MQDLQPVINTAEMAKILGVSTQTVRDWEENLKGVIEVPRDPQGNRYYGDIEQSAFMTINDLRRQKVSWDNIKRMLEHAKETGLSVATEGPTAPPAILSQNHLAEVIKELIQQSSMQQQQIDRLEQLNESMYGVLKEIARKQELQQNLQDLLGEGSDKILELKNTVEQQATTFSNLEKTVSENFGALSIELKGLTETITSSRSDTHQKTGFFGKIFGKKK